MMDKKFFGNCIAWRNKKYILSAEKITSAREDGFSLAFFSRLASACPDDRMPQGVFFISGRSLTRETASISKKNQQEESVMSNTEWLNKYESVRDKLICKTDLDAYFTEKIIGNRRVDVLYM